jgi:hypothetical protein
MPTSEVSGQPAAQGEGSLVSAPAGEGDFLADNGLVSPICNRALPASWSGSSGCAASGFAAAPEPTGDYAFDVHINTGFNLGNDVAAGSEDMLQWAWMALVALVRGLIVMLEWCYSLNLVGSAILKRVAGALRAAEQTFTLPLMATVLAVAAVLAAYHGLIRRRVAQTLGQVAVTVVMMVGGIWAIVDPMGSVGALSGWVNQASVGTLGIVAGGTPDDASRTLADGMHGLFADVVTAPWCYMEFGNVGWCGEARRLDGSLRDAALAIAAQQRSTAEPMPAAGGERERLLESSTLIEAAHTNGAIFLALPANGAARNSINTQGSLLSILCGGSSEATSCKGPTAPQAQFRTEHQAWARAVGLLLIWLGVLGMLALLGWVGLRLLAAAILSLLFLLLAPAAVLAPAFGDGGRGLFRAWATKLLGAITAKLIYSVLLGAVLLMMQVLIGLSELGWWVQWCVISALWWITFLHRHELLSLARVGESAPWTPSGVAGGAGAARRQGLIGRIQNRAVHRLTDAGVLGVGRWAHAKVVRPPLTPQRREQLVGHARSRARATADRQVGAALEHDYRAAQASARAAPSTQSAISRLRTQFDRVALARQASEERGRRHADPDSSAAKADRRRQAELGVRQQRLGAEISAEQGTLTGVRHAVAEGERAHAREGRVFSESQLQDRGRFYDAQAELPDKGRADVGGERRDYRRLAALAGYDERDWDRLAGGDRLSAILRVDNELAARAALQRTPQQAVGAREPSLGRSERRKLDRAHDQAHEQERRRRGHTPAAQPQTSPLLQWVAEERKRAATGDAPTPLSSRARSEAVAGKAPSQPGRAQQLGRRRRQFGSRQRDADDA